MIEYRPFKVGHLAYITPQPLQRREHAMLVQSGAAGALEGTLALSAWRGVTCLGAAGLIHITPYRAMAWAILSDRAGSDMLGITRKVRRVLSAAPYRRVELTVVDGFAEGHRFAKLLGAKRETPEPMRFFGADGEDEVMYAIIREV